MIVSPSLASDLSTTQRPPLLSLLAQFLVVDDSVHFLFALLVRSLFPIVCHPGGLADWDPHVPHAKMTIGNYHSIRHLLPPIRSLLLSLLHPSPMLMDV